jgi:hypothetical protein
VILTEEIAVLEHRIVAFAIRINLRFRNSIFEIATPPAGGVRVGDSVGNSTDYYPAAIVGRRGGQTLEAFFPARRGRCFAETDLITV